MAINYVEKGAGLHSLIQTAGHWLIEVDGVWQSSDDAAVQGIIDAYDLDQCKSDACNAVIVKARECFDRATATVSPAEMAGWSILRAEAMAYNLDTSASCPAMMTEAAMRGCSVAELAQKVTANTQRFDALRAMIAGVSGKHRDAINSLSTFAEVLSYDFTAGWPAV